MQNSESFNLCGVAWKTGRCPVLPCSAICSQLGIDALEDAAEIAAQGGLMASDQAIDGVDGGSPEWRAALIEVEEARQQYARVLTAADSADSEVDNVWLRLWRAERRRDELIKQ